MLPSSHPVPINGAPLAGFENPHQLAHAFSEFISASTLLEASYRDLQQEVAQLSGELAKRNAELTRSIEENVRMRATLEQIIDSMPCGVLVVDAGAAIVRMNPEGRRLLGAHSGRARTLADLRRQTGIDFEPMAATSDDADREVCLVAKAGKRWLAIGRRELNLGAAAAPAASLLSIWILRDITAQKQAEQEREKARRATVLAEISTILAHEIRNPLASLELFAGLIDEQGDPENTQWVAHLRAGIRTLSGTVNNVLSLNGGGSPRLAPLDLVACVGSGVEFVQPLADQAGVVLRFIPPQETLRVRGNEDAIRQILLNLIRNAIHHTPQTGHVDLTIRSERRSGGVLAVVSIRDTGCGISPDAMKHLFEAGYSVSGATPGLGLAVCRQLMTQHGGTVRVSSQVGQGSKFQLEFSAI
ncbi:MAG TPA: ATP-binding protein [Acidobacteriaceae bacterium]|jgi:two-component system sensor histidine kinase FlrB|nr:ATP-binding protein [Acidobacteriaceae bacterium]